jgi:hypothetical protein
MELRGLFFRRRALECGEQAKSCEAMGMKDLAEAYRKAEALWLEMAEQHKRLEK